MPEDGEIRSKTELGSIDFGAILSAIGEGISVQDRNFRIVYQNKAHINGHGNHIGEHCFKAYMNAGEVCENCPVAKVFGDGAVHTSVKVRVAERGNRHMEITAAPLISKHGEVLVTEIVRDITERVTAERELESYRKRLEQLVEEKARGLGQSEERFRLAMLGANDGLWDWDLHTDIVYYSPRWKSMLGYSEEELPETLDTWKRLVHPDDLDSTMALARDLLEGRADKFEVEFRMKHKDGHFLHILSRAFLLQSSEPKSLRLIGTHVDITDRKRQEQALAESEASYRSLFDSSTDGIFVLDLEGRFIDANETAYERLGYTRDEFVALDIGKLDHPSFAVRVPERLSRIRENGAAVFESAHLRKDGSMMPVEVNSRLLEYKGKQVFFSVIRDITDRKKFEEALRESERRYHALFDQSPDGALIVDMEGKIIEFNDAAHRQLGYTREEFEKLSIADIDPTDSPEEIREKIQFIVKQKKATFEVKHRTKAGEIRNVHIINQMIMMAERPVIYSIWHDITGRKETEERIRASLKEKEILLKEIHHRVKNNLQVVASMLRLQAKYIKDRDARLLFDESQKRVETMSLIHEKLYRSKDFSEIAFKDYVDDLLINLLSLHAAKAERIAVTQDIEDIFLNVNSAIPCGLIINELVSNALKHAFPDERRGSISIGMGRDKRGNLSLSVGDNGVGFPRELDFRNTESLGMQLIISLVNQLGGTIELDRSAGSLFRIVFRA